MKKNKICNGLSVYFRICFFCLETNFAISEIENNNNNNNNNNNSNNNNP